jgi:hypothetical protein
MAIAMALAVVAASFFVALGLRVATKVHSFTACFLGTLVLPVILWISEALYPTGWLGVALFFGSPVSAVVAALGALVGRLIVRKRAINVAS